MKDREIMIGFLKIICCVETLFFFFFGQLTELNLISSQSSFPCMWKFVRTVKCFKTKLLKSIGEKWKVAPSPSKTYVCVRIPKLLSPQLISGHSCMLVYGRRVIFRAPLQFSISEVILWWCLWRLMQHFCLSNNIYHHCFLQYLSQMDYLG